MQRYRRQSSRRHCGRFLVELQLQSDELLELLVAPPPPSPTELLNLSQCGVGRLECYLLAIALSRGLMTGVQVLWLQDNQVDECCVLWLARGIDSMPLNSQLRSISLGANPATTAPSARRAVASLEAAGRARRIKIRPAS